MTMRELEEGSVFAGRYRIERAIAKGGMGAVYEVVHIETERRRALKVMLPHIVSSDELRQRFRQEARVAAKVESAYIVDVFDAGVDEETKMPFLVMELLRGEEVGKRLARLGRLSAREVVTFLGQTALALDKTHRANIVHRDLKPENLFLAEDEDGSLRIKVLDFGIAKLIAEQGTEANATQSIGTPMYMAPEQFLPRSKVSPATDIFALGMMAYTLLVGSPYWREEKEALGNVYAFVGAVMAGPVESAIERALRQGVELPVAFEAWFARVTDKDPAKRFGKASEAIKALAVALGAPRVAEGLSTPTAHEPGEAAQVFTGITPAPMDTQDQATGFGLSSTHSGAVGKAGSFGPSSPHRRRRSLALFVAAGFFLVASLLALVFVLVMRGRITAKPASVVAAESMASSALSSLPAATASLFAEPVAEVVPPMASASVVPEVKHVPEKPMPVQQAVQSPTSTSKQRSLSARPRPPWGGD